MKVTIDQAGRLVVPKPLRDRLRLDAGTILEIRAREGRLELEPVDAPDQTSGVREMRRALREEAASS